MIKKFICVFFLGIKEHLKATNWKSSSKITKILEFFPFNLLLKLCIKLFRQFKFCFTCTYKIERLKTPNPWIDGPIFVGKIIWLRWLICNWQLFNAMKSLAIKKICSVSIWLVGIPRICQANDPTTSHLCSRMRHQDNVHLQFCTSTWQRRNASSSCAIIWDITFVSIFEV